ncbi:MAG: hypothetical protein QF877_02340, partial [Gammaproteobacteria bacterium]|nr:hypothetical protein [Gammaproteobacteria bacterium]
PHVRMNKNSPLNPCYICSIGADGVQNLYGYDVCHSCKSKLGLLKDNTLRKHILSYEKVRETVPENPTYKEEVDYRLNYMEENYIRQRIKLLHIQERLKEIG